MHATPRATQQLDEREALRAALAEAISGEVRFDEGSTATYATDASNYRAVPIGVVLPHSVDDAVATVAECHARGVPVLSRGGGTSLAGQFRNTAVVLDWTKYCRHLVSVDADNRTAVVEPGVSLDPLTRQLAPYGLMVGQKPSTHASCTIGGMVGNNSCGSTAARSLVVFGYPDVHAAADAVPDVLERRPSAREGLDHRLVELEHSEQIAGKALAALPQGCGWAMV